MVGDLEVEVGPSHPEVTEGTGRGPEEVGGPGHRDDEGLGAETVEELEEPQLPVTEAASGAEGVGAGVPLLHEGEAAEPARLRKRKLPSALHHLRGQSPKRKRETTRPVLPVRAVLLKTNRPSKYKTGFFAILKAIVFIRQ